MGEWIRCADAFVAGDVIRWTEDVEAYPKQAADSLKKRGRRGAKVEGVRIGERLVTAQVQRERNRPGFVCLVVLDCEITWEKRKNLAIGIDTGKRVDRAEGTLYKGRAQRRPWDHENVRSDMVAEQGATGGTRIQE